MWTFRLRLNPFNLPEQFVGNKAKEIYRSLFFSQNEEEVLLLGGVHESERGQGMISEDTYEAFNNHLKGSSDAKFTLDVV